MWKVFLVTIFCVTLVSASCPKDCRCPLNTPRCAAGVSLMLDGCGCCKVCAQQLFEDCSETQPCDHTKGLECNFGGGHGSVKGVCRAKLDGRTCEYNNKIYQNGEIFRPNCKHQCTCMDGAVGCVSFCPHELMLSKLGCALPRRVKVPGRCCKQLICPKRREENTVVKRHMKKPSKDGRASENDLANGNELTSVWRGGSESLPAFRGHPSLIRRVECVFQTTAWSACSMSCGTGVSTRVTNSNIQCKMVNETRICQIRPCNQMTFTTLKGGQKCNPTEKAIHPAKLSHAGCRSLKKLQLRYCGSCSVGQCCRPHQTQTAPVRFRCRNGKIISRMVMMIESCRCNQNCPSSHEETAALYTHSKDVHKLENVNY